MSRPQTRPATIHPLLHARPELADLPCGGVVVAEAVTG